MNKFDYALIDCPPSLGILSLNSIFTADYFIVPVNYDKYSLDGLSDLFDILAEVKETENYKYKILRSMKDPRSKRTNTVIEQALDDFKSNMFKTSIRRAEALNQALMEVLPVELSSNPSAPICEDFKLLAQEVIKYAV